MCLSYLDLGLFFCVQCGIYLYQVVRFYMDRLLFALIIFTMVPLIIGYGRSQTRYIFPLFPCGPSLWGIPSSCKFKVRAITWLRQPLWQWRDWGQRRLSQCVLECVVYIYVCVCVFCVCSCMRMSENVLLFFVFYSDDLMDLHFVAAYSQTYEGPYGQ